MSNHIHLDDYEVGYDIPAKIGMSEADIQTPCLVIDLNAFERNVEVMRAYCASAGVQHRLHGKMHKSVDVAKFQIAHGDACGVCCQKVSEAEVFARAGITDILVSNQVRDPVKIDRLARLPELGARIICCVDDIDNVAELSAAAVKHGTEIEVLVEIECGAERCGVAPGQPVVDIAKATEAAAGLRFSGIQAYQGAMQHIQDFSERKAKIDIVLGMVRESMDLLKQAGLECAIVSGGGTGSYYFEGGSGIYTELQCGSYAFMDADYQSVHNADGQPLSEFTNALFVLTSVMSIARADKAVCDAGLKAHAVDSGLPYVYGRTDVEYIGCSDEHGVISDPHGFLRINEKLKLVPGHCDPTCNLHDWYVGVRNGSVECLWPVSARGHGF